MNIAFLLRSSDKWKGGANYINNLLFALHKTFKEELQTTLLVRKGTPKTAYSHLDDYVTSVLIYQPDDFSPKQWSSQWFMQKLGLTRPVSFTSKEYFHKHGIDVIFTFSKDKEVSIPSISWIPDFQHLHLPEMFSEKARQDRDKKFRRLIQLATRVILSSEDAFSDFCQFAPDFKHKGSVMHFMAQVPESVYTQNSYLICQKYNLPDKFIYLPNQFWKHKNHTVAFEAVRILKDKDINIFLVCSGSKEDYRHREYFTELEELISQWNINKQIAILGLVPREDVYTLMRQSISLLNPSLFEGWSSSVEEAKSLGKRVILSNIKVHQEQNPPSGFYFNPHEPEELAGVMKEIWLNTPPGPDLDLENKARNEITIRTGEFAQTFLQIANLTLKT